MLIILDDCTAVKRRERSYRRASQARLLYAPCQPERVGADPAVLQHRKAFPRERGGDRVLHAIGEDREGYL